MQKILITGGAGFIGSNFVRHMLNEYKSYRLIVLDALTYAGNLENLADVWQHPNFIFYKGNIGDPDCVANVVQNVDAIVNFAAETHVDRSIHGAGNFVQTDVYGTFTLLEAAKKYKIERYLQISTDEVYGSILEGAFQETDPLRPSSPYSASKASGDMLVHSYYVTYDLPVLITRSSNNYGPYQYPEKLIPLFITNALENKPLPLYGDGQNVRDWIYVEDNCKAVDYVLHHGTIGEVYNIGGGNERTNIYITKKILQLLDKPESLITPVKDRPGHDRRYAVDCSKIQALGWKPQVDFEEGIAKTVHWYQDHPQWWMALKAKKADFQAFYRKNYESS
ncbi:MAG: dTDP-glucose 4,6-dehydratase [Gemmatimonadetes bacterium]|nr:MAG: dTDP-glucose 4,6-dehydratase [Gemmatimonadota bacterium]